MPALRPCSVIGCPELTDRGGKCATHRAEAEAKRPSRQARGYDANHDRQRRRVARLVRRGGVTCARCGQPIDPSDDWHLDHTDDRAGYLGPSHARCNTSAGGRAAWGGG
jgi:hypothetical protein